VKDHLTGVLVFKDV